MRLKIEKRSQGVESASQLQSWHSHGILEPDRLLGALNSRVVIGSEVKAQLPQHLAQPPSPALRTTDSSSPFPPFEASQHVSTFSSEF